MLERSNGLADRTKHHVQQIQGISTTRLWSLYLISQLSLNILPIWTRICTGCHKMTTLPCLDYMVKFC
jgi:uncharacterized membrane protein